MLRMKRTLPTILLILILLPYSCQPEEDELIAADTVPEGTYPLVQSELWPYFKKFEEEGRSRGLVIDLNKASITGSISDIAENQVIGQCHYNSLEPEKVTIDLPFWNRATTWGKEFVVFHELGHCFLTRAHNESQNAQGFCLSIMRSGTGTCRDQYNTTTRASLLDELFRGN
jgi:hypothetical protein